MRIWIGEAPSTFLMPISFVFLDAMKATKPSKPNTANIMAIKVKTPRTDANLFSVLKSVSNSSSTKKYWKGICAPCARQAYSSFSTRSDKSVPSLILTVRKTDLEGLKISERYDDPNWDIRKNEDQKNMILEAKRNRTKSKIN